MDAVAPISSGSITVLDDTVTLDLEIALDQVKANLILQTATRSLVKQHGATQLTFHGTGSTHHVPIVVSGSAQAGEICVDLELSITCIGVDAHLSGEVHLGTVELPLPGLGRIEDLSFTVESHVTLARH